MRVRPAPAVSLAIAVISSACVMQSHAWGRDIVQEPFSGVTHITRIETTVRPLFINIVEIDLNDPGIRFQLSPRDPGGPLFNGVQDETITQTTRQYVDEINAQVGINASFFRLEHGGEARWTNNNHLAVSNGDVYSDFGGANNYAINITQNNLASIIKSTTTGFTPNTTLYNAVSGNVDVLRSGDVVDRVRSTDPGNNNYLHPRTAVGVNQAGNKVWMVTVDGRQTGFSEGMYHDELGSLFKSLGAYNAINLDGGGSTTMAFDYYGDQTANGGNRRSQLINGGTGERYNGNSLGLFAAPNPSYVAKNALPNSITLLDDFEKNEGRFTSGWNSSGTTDGISSNSSFDWTGQESGNGWGSQELNLDYQDDGTGNLILRHLSGGGSPANNAQLGQSGFIGFLLKVGAGDVQTGDFKASLLIDDTNPGDVGAKMEKALPIDIIADGEWHLYQWDLSDAALWEAFVGGDGSINATDITLDSIHLEALTYRGDAQFFLDAVSYNSAEGLNVLIPEPASAVLWLGAAALFTRRRRA